jgi:hypothetical protein
VKVLKTVDSVGPSNKVRINGTSVNASLIILSQATVREVEVNEELGVAISFLPCNTCTDLVKATASQYPS